MTGVVEDTVGTLVVDSGVTVVAVVVSVVRVVGVTVDSTSSVVTVGDVTDDGTLDPSTVKEKKKQTG